MHLDEIIRKHVNNTELKQLFQKLYPICRSISGKGFDDSLKILGKIVKLNIIKFKTGSKVLDCTIPKVWNIKDAYILTPQNKKIAEFKKHNLHLVNYSQPVIKTLPLTKLKKKIFTTFLTRYMIQAPSVTLVKTLVFVKDGPIWAVKFIYISWII